MAKDTVWQKSSYSGGNDSSDCVELAATADGAVLLRESDAPADVLAATPTALAALILGLRSGRLGNR